MSPQTRGASCDMDIAADRNVIRPIEDVANSNVTLFTNDDTPGAIAGTNYFAIDLGTFPNGNPGKIATVADPDFIGKRNSFAENRIFADHHICADNDVFGNSCIPRNANPCRQ